MILTNIYAASETPITGVSSEKLAAGITAATGQKVKFLPRLVNVRDYLVGIVKEGDLVMTVGAGDVFKVGEDLVKELEHKNEANK